MPMPTPKGALSSAEKVARANGFLTSLERTGAIPIADVLGFFGADAPAVFTAFNNHQWGKHIVECVLAKLNSLEADKAAPDTKLHVTELMKAPLPDGISRALAWLMIGNPASFSKEIEEIIDADPIALDLMPRGSAGSPEKRLSALEALRARRVIMAGCVQLEIPHGSEGIVAQIQALSQPPLPGSS